MRMPGLLFMLAAGTPLGAYQLNSVIKVTGNIDAQHAKSFTLQKGRILTPQELNKLLKSHVIYTPGPKAIGCVAAYIQQKRWVILNRCPQPILIMVAFKCPARPVWRVDNIPMEPSRVNYTNMPYTCQLVDIDDKHA